MSWCHPPSPSFRCFSKHIPLPPTRQKNPARSVEPCGTRVCSVCDVLLLNWFDVIFCTTCLPIVAVLLLFFLVLVEEKRGLFGYRIGAWPSRICCVARYRSPKNLLHRDMVEALYVGGLISLLGLFKYSHNSGFCKRLNKVVTGKVWNSGRLL